MTSLVTARVIGLVLLAFPFVLVLSRLASLSASYIIELNVVSVTVSSRVIELFVVRLLTVRWAPPGWLLRERNRAECRVCFAMLDVTRVI